MALQLADTAILPFDVQNYAQVFDRGKKHFNILNYLSKGRQIL
jgi:hypothetical protein